MEERERPRAATKRGRHMLLAGVVAVALLGGLAVGVPSAGANITGTKIEICKGGPVSGSYQFLVDRTTSIWVAVGTCRGVAVSAGTHTVTEAPDPTGATTLTNIQIKPSTAGTRDIAKRTATVNVPADGQVLVRFVNRPATGLLKVCKVAGDPALQGHTFSFTETAGGTTLGPTSVVAGTDNPLNCTDVSEYQTNTRVHIAELPSPGTAVSSIQVIGGGSAHVDPATGTVVAIVSTAVTEVVYTNVPVIPQNPGYLEVCKNAGDSYVGPGPWTFNITSGGTTVAVEHVLAGQCSGDVALPAGQYGVSEVFSSPDYVSSIAAVPSGSLLSQNTANGEAVFSVATGATTSAFFTNNTQTGYVKVCKTLASNAAALTGTPFNFNVSDAAGTQVVTVIASSPGQTACSPDFTALPVGSVATITEQSTPNVALTGVQVTPAYADAGSTSTTAKVTVATTINAATFTNEALGWVEVCKRAGDASVSGSFGFSVNGGAAVSVLTGQCSQPIQVPAGTATITELNSNSAYYLAGVSTQGVTDPTGSRLLGVSGNTATVQVPFGGVGTETVATFTNATNQGAFKICTAQTSPDAALAGVSFPYTYSYTVNGTTTTGTVNLVVPTTGSTCSQVVGSIPVINADGSAVHVSVTAGAPAVVSVDLAGFDYQGSGSVISSPLLPAAFPASATYSLGQGMNVTTFTNGATH